MLDPAGDRTRGLRRRRHPRAIARNARARLSQPGNGVIRHNGRDYAEGDTIALTKPEWEQLAPLKVLAGEA